MKLVLIEWIDSSGCTTDWNDLDSERELPLVSIRSVGWLIKQDEDRTIITPHIADLVNEPKQGMGTTVISAKSIKAIHELPDPTVTEADGASRLEQLQREVRAILDSQRNDDGKE